MMERVEERIEGTAFGFPFVVRGLNMVVLLALMGVTSYTIWFLSVKVSDEHHTIAEVMTRQNEILEEQNYILLADPEETDFIKKKMKMPKTLRQKLEP